MPIYKRDVDDGDDDDDDDDINCSIYRSLWLN